MTDRKTETDHLDAARAALVEAALSHVTFDGWSEATLSAAIEDAGVDPALARLALPRGAVDLALAYHREGDAAMLARFAATDTASLRIREKIATLVRLRIEAAEDREVIRKGLAFFAMPAHAADGSAALWGTADQMWCALGDSSKDFNWYSKRAILSGVYSATLLYWLGDDSPDKRASWSFLDRRIENVMQFEQAKAKLRATPLWKALENGPGQLFSKIRAPGRTPRDDLPGHIK